MGEYCIIPLEERHIKPLVNIHLRAFPGFFLTFLGPRFLNLFYSSFLDEETGISWVAVDNGTRDMLGAVVGTTSPSGFYRKLAFRRWCAFSWASVSAVFKDPSIVRRLFRALAYRGDPPSHSDYALLSSIAVAPETQGKGVGKALLNAWLEEARKRACAGAYLTTDALHNDQVNLFYQRTGWVLESTSITPQGRKMNRYILSFHKEKP